MKKMEIGIPADEKMSAGTSKKNHGNLKLQKKTMPMKMTCILMMMAFLLLVPSMGTYAAGTGVIEAQFATLKNIVTSIISSMGTIITLWGISEWGIAFQGQDGTMQAHAFKRIAGGLVMTLAPQIVAMF